jgi:hypothetical protein
MLLNISSGRHARREKDPGLSSSQQHTRARYTLGA